MSKETVAYQFETAVKRATDVGFKQLYTTHGFRLLGIVTWDKPLLDESLGEKRRLVKGLKIENGTPISSEQKIFETFLDRKNPRSGQLEDVVVHEDDFIILMERKSFDLSDEDENFQFIPNMHLLNHVQQLKDGIDAGNRRLSRLKAENEEAFLDSEHFKQEALTAKERERSNTERLNRITRENSHLQEKIGNLESAYQLARAKNLEYESQLDEMTANAPEKGTLRGMSDHDLLIHAAEKEKDLSQAMHEIGPETEAVSEQIQSLQDELRGVKEVLRDRLKTEPSAPKKVMQ